MPPELQELLDQLDAVERDSRQLTSGLTEDLGRWRERPDSWSIAECLDHLATSNRVYLGAMAPSARRAGDEQRLRRGPALPGIIGRTFVRYLEPPVKSVRTKAPAAIRPRTAPPLGESFAAFLGSQEEVRGFVREYAALDLGRIRFPNPLIAGIRFSLATGLHVIAAHERRHLWQAWRIRRAAEGGS